jgi:predicted ArsR family transcriptional regulator
MFDVHRLDALGDPELRRTLLYVRRQGEPVTSADAAAALGVPRTAVRHRLERLVAAGLVETAFVRRSGRTGPGAGRPAKTYTPTVELTQVEFPRRRYERLVELTMRALPRRGRAARLGEIGVAFGEELARAAGIRSRRRVTAGLDELCRGLGSLGFHAAVLSVTASEAVLETATCPLRPVVVADPGARALDQGMWRALVAAALPGAAGSCETGSCFDAGSSCRVRVSLRG